MCSDCFLFSGYRDHGERHKINARPLLGREEKLEIYKNLIQKYVSAKNIREQQYKMLLIKGEARQGKTRLLDEIVYITPEEIPVIRFSLTTKDQKVGLDGAPTHRDNDFFQDTISSYKINFLLYLIIEQRLVY